jgi:sigma-E factor negative regulatory protein RseB
MLLSRLCAFLALCCLWASAAYANQEEAWVVLQKASQAAHELSYKGVFVYQSGGATKSVQLTHTNYGHGEYARMMVLDGSPREVLSQGDDASIYSPKNEKVLIEKKRGQSMFPALLPIGLDSIKHCYQAQLGAFERVGGREAQVVTLVPKDNMRYGFRFWADKEYGLLLKVAMLNDQGVPLEQIGFSQLAWMEDQNMDWFRPKLDPSKAYVMGAENAPLAKVESGEMDFGVTELPQGYRKIDQVKQNVPGKQVPVTQVIFSDGLSSISLFIEPLAKGMRPKVGHTIVGATNIYALVNEGHQVMVVGEVPEATVMQFANAVSFKSKTK